MHLTDLVIIVFSPSTLNDNIVYYCKLIIVSKKPKEYG